MPVSAQKERVKEKARKPKEDTTKAPKDMAKREAIGEAISPISNGKEEKAKAKEKEKVS